MADIIGVSTRVIEVRFVSHPVRQMTTQRRDFLGWLGGSSLLALGGAPVSLHPHARPGRAHPTPVDDKFNDVSWADKVQGKFRAVFDSPEISEGAALFRAMVWCDEYKAVYGTARSDMSAVLVVRHEAIQLAMNDEYWKRFKIGKEVRLKTPEGKKWAEANPIRASPPDTPPEFAKYNLENFIARKAASCSPARPRVLGSRREVQEGGQARRRRGAPAGGRAPDPRRRAPALRNLRRASRSRGGVQIHPRELNSSGLLLDQAVRSRLLSR